MENESAHRDVEVFAQALALAGPERLAYLDHSCSGDVPLRERVERLLGIHEAAGDFLQMPPSGSASVGSWTVRVGERPGDCIGRYKLLQQIGEGGCGVVFMADQEEPIRRRVALKIIKPGMD